MASVSSRGSQTAGLALGLGVGTNLSLAGLTRMSKAGMIDFGAERTLVGRYISRFRIETPTVEGLIGPPERRDQRTIMLAKWLGDPAQGPDRRRAHARRGCQHQGRDLRLMR